MFVVGDKVRFFSNILKQYVECEVLDTKCPAALMVKDDLFGTTSLPISRVTHIWLRNRWFALEG